MTMINDLPKDQEIVALYFARAEAATEHTQKKFGSYCLSIARRILGNEQDAEECVNDTYLRAWESIPPHRPENLAAYLGKLTRSIAINRDRERQRLKRGGGRTEEALEELAACIPDPGENAETWTKAIVLQDAMQAFLATLPAHTVRIFLQRYFYLCSIGEIAREMGIGESRVKMTLLRTREKLRAYLEQQHIL
ncbi:MAG: sigma-70 family RNA polymerase sigma factor [Clostridia bacterium]|nr:sigma-70 family RNA polymerase sigma factor [Clostridia bacterium]